MQLPLLTDVGLFLDVGCDASCDEAGCEGGQTERDQTRTAELRETEGETCSFRTIQTEKRLERVGTEGFCCHTDLF